MRTPKNKILENQYTSGGEYLYDSNGTEYIGYYHIIGGTQYFTGATQESPSFRLLKIEEIPNTQLRKLNTSILDGDNIVSHQFVINDDDILNGYSKRYFVKKQNSNPILIKEINKETFDYLQDKIIYQTVSFDYYFTIDSNYDNACNKMLGLREFLS